MHDELSIRQTAIRLRLAGERIESICRTLQHSETWFYKWWRRYLEAGPAGLYDLTQGNRQVVNRTPPHIERAVISIRRRLAARATPQTRYNHVGAAQIRAELETLCIRQCQAFGRSIGLSPGQVCPAHHSGWPPVSPVMNTPVPKPKTPTTSTK